MSAFSRLSFSLLALFLSMVSCTFSERKTDAAAAVSTASDSTKETPDSSFSEGEEMNDSIPVGDVNGDGKKDLAVLLNHFPKNEADSQYVTFTFPGSAPSFEHGDAFHGILTDAGDLDGNGTDELLYVPDWYQSNWAALFVYGLRNGRWQRLAQADIRRDKIWDAENPEAYLQSRVKKIGKGRFNILEHFMDEETADIADRTLNITVPK